MTEIVKTKEQELQAITKKLASVVKSVLTIQGSVHELLIDTTLYTFKYKGEGVDLVAKVLNGLTGVRGSFRVESVAYWYKHIAGVDCVYNKAKDRFECSLAKDTYISDLGVAFTYDRIHLALCKLEANHFWKVAPVVIKELKMPGDVEKATQSAEIMLARALAGGSLSEEEIKAHLVNMMDRVKQISSNGKTKEWLEAYYLQNPSEKPGSVKDVLVSDAESQEIEDMLEADRIKALEL